MSSLILKIRGMAYYCTCMVHVVVPEQALGSFSLGLELVMEDEPSKVSYMLL